MENEKLTLKELAGAVNRISWVMNCTKQEAFDNHIKAHVKQGFTFEQVNKFLSGSDKK